MTNLPGLTASFDALNRVSQTGPGSQIKYAYGANNQRLATDWMIYFYGPDGKRLGTYRTYESVQEEGGKQVYFAGRLLEPVDRLGSVRVDKTGKNLDVYPYGQEKPATITQTREKFTTYYRDGILDYASQRYYASRIGRFMSPDPYQASGTAGSAELE